MKNYSKAEYIDAKVVPVCPSCMGKKHARTRFVLQNPSSEYQVSLTPRCIACGSENESLSFCLTERDAAEVEALA